MPKLRHHPREAAAAALRPNLAVAWVLMAAYPELSVRGATSPGRAEQAARVTQGDAGDRVTAEKQSISAYMGLVGDCKSGVRPTP